MSDAEQEARIALLQHHTSQMQGYKTSILTVAIIVLTIFEVWSRILPAYHNFPASLIMSGALGASLTLAIAFVARVFWYEQLVRSTTKTPERTHVQVRPLIGQLDDDIWKHAELEAEGKGEEKQNWVWRKLIQLGSHSKPKWSSAIWIGSFVALTLATLLVSSLFGLGSRVRIVATEANVTTDFAMILSQVLLVVATFLVAVVTYLVFHATKEMAHNTIRPFLVISASTPEQRKEYFTSSNFPSVSGEQPKGFIEKKGIIVENVGLGPAVEGRITVLLRGTAMSETFRRLHVSGADRSFRYFYPSPTARNIAIPEDVQEISIEARFCDVAGKHYRQKLQRIKI